MPPSLRPCRCCQSGARRAGGKARVGCGAAWCQGYSRWRLLRSCGGWRSEDSVDGREVGPLAAMHTVQREQGWALSVKLVGAHAQHMWGMPGLCVCVLAQARLTPIVNCLMLQAHQHWQAGPLRLAMLTYPCCTGGAGAAWLGRPSSSSIA